MEIYSLLVAIYLFSCFLYNRFFLVMYAVSEIIYQNAASKNRAEIQKVKDELRIKKSLYVFFVWPFYEMYRSLKK